MPPVILIVEDHEAVRRSLREWLQGAFPAARILEAASGEAAVAEAEATRPDVVLMDIGLPGMNGIEAAARLRARHPGIRVVMLTILEEAGYRARAREAGAVAYVPKRLMETDLLPVLTGLLSSPPAPAPPPAAGEAAAAGTPGSPEPGRPTRMRTILIVDDSGTMRRMVMAALRELPEVAFVEAASGLEAIEKLALARADLMVLDLNMPDVHGLEVLQFTRRHQAYREIPVLVLTTRGEESARSAAQAAGASCYLTKPFEPRTLAAHVRRLLEG